ncbi:MAG: hypothetical protein ACE5OS_00805 [Anaerolineae bacterium]
MLTQQHHWFAPAVAAVHTLPHLTRRFAQAAQVAPGPVAPSPFAGLMQSEASIW